VHDPLTVLNALPELEFRKLAQFNGGQVGVFWSGPGVTPWERHPEDDELLQVLEGEADVTVWTEEGPITATVKAGHLLVVPRGLWHRHEIHDFVKELYLTPDASEHSSAEDPTQV
jgi:quercetin dioxygenase-like cupin family protein